MTNDGQWAWSMNGADPWFSLGFAAVLLGASAVLICSHIRAWRRFRTQPLEPWEHDYRRRQFRRRMQSSAMLGLLALAVLVGPWMTSPPLTPLVPLAFWGLSLLVVFWVGLLAAADMLSTRYHYARLRDRHRLEQVCLEAQLRRAEQRRANGKPRK